MTPLSIITKTLKNLIDQQLLREVKRKDKDDNVLVMYVSNDESGIKDNDTTAHDKDLNKPTDEETIRQEFKSLKDDKKVKILKKKIMILPLMTKI